MPPHSKQNSHNSADARHEPTSSNVLEQDLMKEASNDENADKQREVPEQSDKAPNIQCIEHKQDLANNKMDDASNLATLAGYGVSSNSRVDVSGEVQERSTPSSWCVHFDLLQI